MRIFGSTLGFLAALPDGVIEGENTIVAVKCLNNTSQFTVKEASERIGIFCLSKERHSYYY